MSANSSSAANSTRTARSSASAHDDPRLSIAIDAYLQACEVGRPPDIDAFVELHSEIADELRDCLRGLALMREAAPEITHSGGFATLEFGASLVEPLGDYRILREVGRGGMGIVYEAEQLSLARRVALKILPFAAVLDPRQLQRFKNEALAAAQLDHPNIVSVYSVGCDRGVHYFAMRFVDGQSLADVVEARRASQKQAAGSAEQDFASTGSLPNALTFADTAPVLEAVQSTLNSNSRKERFRRIAEIGVQAAEALEHAHQMGVIHRDIKPSNLLLDHSGRLWVTDFGLARIVSDTPCTISGDLLGTLRYMSPEQAAGRPESVDHRTDIYSLGATLYELSTGQPVVCNRERTAMLREIEEREPSHPRSIDPAVPADIETILLKCLAKEPAERYETAQGLADDLRRFLEGVPIAARRPTWWDRTHRWSRRHFDRLASAAIGTVLALVCAVTVLAYEQSKTRQANEKLTREQQRTQLALIDAQQLRAAAEARMQLTLRAVEFARQRQQAIYQIHLLQGTVHTAPGGPDWLSEVVGPDHVQDFDQIITIHLEPSEAGTGLAFLSELDELQILHIDGAHGFKVTDADMPHLSGLSSLQALSLTNIDITDEGLKQLTALTQLQSLRLAHVPITDQGLKYLELDKMRQLGSLMLDGTQVGDVGMAEIAKCGALWMLMLDHTTVGDAGLAKIASLAGLRDLMLKGTQVSDAGLTHLAELTQLRTLYLNGTSVTDAGLAHLHSLPQLHDVAAFDTPVTAAGAAAFSEKHPQCNVGFGPSPPDGEPDLAVP